MYLECHSCPIVDIMAINEDIDKKCNDNEPYFNLDNFKIVRLENAGLKIFAKQRKLFKKFINPVGHKFQFKIEILNLNLLNFVREQGSKIFVIAEEVFDLVDNSLVIEGDIG
jgi:hypothetical protein